MGFRELEREFKEQVKSDPSEPVYKYWMLRLLFEIAGNLDSLVVSYREMVKFNKDRLNGK